MQPKNGDGFVNWLTTHLINALGHTPVARIRARITTFQGKEICRVDVAATHRTGVGEDEQGNPHLFRSIQQLHQGNPGR